MKKKLLCFLYGTIPNRYYGKKKRSISKVLSCALIQKETPVDRVLWFGCKRAKRSERHSCARSARPPHDCGVQIKPPQEHLHGVRALQLRYEQLFDEKGSFFHLRDGAAVPKRQQRAVCCMAVFCLQRQKRAGQGDMTARAPGGGDEFGAIGDRFNQMMQEIDGLLDDLVEVRVEKRQAEIEALQQQIRPHFMYNTLNTIKFAAILQGNPEIGALLGSFIELLEASISKKGAFIPLSDEIRLVEDYASLQKYRYMDNFTVECDITPEAADCMVPRLLLQPLVENAILHGILPRRPGNRITVDGAVEGGMLHILVADNGKGMTAEECRALLENDPDDNRRFTGIGTRNVRERLRLYYGEQATFSIHSAPGEGTCITLSLPAVPEAKPKEDTP